MSLQLFNMYMPYDIRSNDDLYCDMFSDILNVYNTMNYFNFIIVGDLNTSIRRVSNCIVLTIFIIHVVMNQSSHVLVLKGIMFDIHTLVLRTMVHVSWVISVGML